MAVESFELSLRGYYKDGHAVTRDVFAEPLNARRSEGIVDVVCDRGSWQSGLIVLSQRRVSDYEQESEPHEAFAAEIRVDLERIARWLVEREEGVSRIKEAGLTVDVFMDVWIDQDQLELSLPPSLLLACGRLGLEVQIVTND